MICFAGPLPPPTFGMASVNADVVQALSKGMPVKAFPVGGDSTSRSLRGHLVKAKRAICAVGGLVSARRKGARVFYGSVDDGPGGIWTLLFVLTARLCGYRIFLHHHSFRYITVHSWLMATIVAVAGRETVHIVLCAGMKRAMVARYAGITRSCIAPNPAPMRASAPLPAKRRSGITLGLLSNLWFDKGIAEFVELIEAATRRGLDIHGVLAGPALNLEVEAYLRAALARNQDRLKWVGPVAGAAKEEFFQAIDLFVFPTKYRSEAYPLVLVEALERGLPILSVERGCIGAFSEYRSARILKPDEEFLPNALEWLHGLAADSSHLAAMKKQARRDGRALNAQNHSARRELIALLQSAVYR